MVLCYLFEKCFDRFQIRVVIYETDMMPGIGNMRRGDERVHLRDLLSEFRRKVNFMRLLGGDSMYAKVSLNISCDPVSRLLNRCIGLLYRVICFMELVATSY